MNEPTPAIAAINAIINNKVKADAPPPSPESKPSGPEFWTHRVLSNVSTCAPTVRMVVVKALVWDDGGKLKVDVEVSPVVALRTYVVTEFMKRNTARTFNLPITLSTVSGMVEKGWQEESHEIETEAVIADPEHGLIGTEDAICGCSISAHRVVACPWPTEQDDDKLKDHIADITASAVNKAGLKHLREPAQTK